MPLVLTSQPSAHLWAQLQSGEWFQFTVCKHQLPRKPSTKGKGKPVVSLRGASISPEVPAKQSSAVYSCHLGNTTLNGLVLPGPLSLLLCPVFWSHFPNKLLALALGSFFASHAFRRALAIETYIELSVYRKYRRQRNKITVDSRDVQFSQDGWLVFQANRTPENKG